VALREGSSSTLVCLLLQGIDSLDKIEVVNRLRKQFAYETVKNYTVNYDQTWIYDKIQ
jgi:hypothetical protein